MVLRRRGGFTEGQRVCKKERGFQKGLVSKRLEGSRKDWWFPRNRGGFREGHRCFKNEEGFRKDWWWTCGLRGIEGVSVKDSGVSRMREGFRKD